MTFPPPPQLPPAPPVQDMSVGELAALVEARNVYRAKAVFELAGRVRTDDSAATRLAELSRLPVLRDDRLHGFVSLAWAAIVGLLGAETPLSRDLAYDAFSALPPTDQDLFLSYLRVARIEDAHPQL